MLITNNELTLPENTLRLPSAEWKANQDQSLTSPAFVEVSYFVGDPDLNIEDVNCANSLSPKSENIKTTDAFERNIVRYATLETDFWQLDGSMVTVIDHVNPEKKYEDSGYISNNLCGTNGLFTNPYPTVEIILNPTVELLPGVTITWGGAWGDEDSAHTEYPIEFWVTAYNTNDPQAAHTHKVLNNNKVISDVVFEMENFNRIKIEIVKWCRGNRRARIGKIFRGINKVYRESDLMKFSVTQEVDPLSAELPKYEVSFEIDNRNKEYDPNNETGLAKYMMERQEIRTRYGYRTGNATGYADDDNIEWIPGGVYFLSDWTAPQNGLSASFKARDLMGFLDGTYYQGTYNANGTALSVLAEKVLNEAKLPYLKNKAPRWIIDESLDYITTKSPLPVSSFAECLQLIANAARSLLFFDRNGTLHIAPLPTLDVNNEFIDINNNNSYSKAEISLLKPLKLVYVSMYGWQIEDGAPKELYSSSLPLNKGRNEFIIEYSDSATNLEPVIKVFTIENSGAPGETKTEVFSGFDVISPKSDGDGCYAKNCKVVIDYNRTEPAECSIVIRGKVIKSTETIVSVENSEVGEIIPLKNVLITDSEQAKEVGRWLRDRYNIRKSISLDWRVDPSIDPLDVVTLNKNPEQETQQIAQIFSAGFDFSGAFKGKSEGMVIPWPT